jgi:uncharacterized spore protein YtfJ
MRFASLAGIVEREEARADLPPASRIDPKGGVMQVEELLSGARDAMSAKRVYGDPYEKNGLTVIPAATVRGGDGGGAGDTEAGESGRGGGFGLVARPSGAWVVESDDVTWKPAIDVNRIVLGGQIIAMTAIIMTGRILLAQSRRRHPLLDFVQRLEAIRLPQFHLPRREQQRTALMSLLNQMRR